MSGGQNFSQVFSSSLGPCAKIAEAGKMTLVVSDCLTTNIHCDPSVDILSNGGIVALVIKQVDAVLLGVYLYTQTELIAYKTTKHKYI